MAITNFPTDLESYRDFMEHIASVSIAIQHNVDGEKRFCSVSQSFVPFPKWDLKEFTSGQRSGFDKLKDNILMALVDLDSDKTDYTGGGNEGALNGSFMLLKKARAENGDWTNVRTAKSECLTEGESIMTWIAEFMKLNGKHGVLLDEKGMNEPVGPIENDLYGYRFYFSWRAYKTKCYDATKFTENPEKL